MFLRIIIMSLICVKIFTEEYFIKKAKPLSNASQVYLNKKYIGLSMNLIPLYNKYNIDKKENGYEITLYVNAIFRKEAKKRGHGAYCYLPLYLAGENILIFESPY